MSLFFFMLCILLFLSYKLMRTKNAALYFDIIVIKKAKTDHKPVACTFNYYETIMLNQF